MHPVLSAGLALFAFLASSFQPPVDILRDSFPDEQFAVEKVLHDILHAAEDRDVARLASHHHHGPKFTKFDDRAPLERLDAERARARERETLLALKAFRPNVEDLKVDVFGPVAIATFVKSYTLVTERETTHGRARATLVFVKSNGAWKIVHEHLSAFSANP